MSFQWPLQKLDVIQRALLLTGDSIPNVANDGSDEWNVASAAYETALSFLIEDHTWGFATKVNQNLTPSNTAPLNTAWDTAFPLPSDLVHLIWVRINQDTTDPTTNTLGQPCLYDIEAGQLVLNAQGGPPPPSPAQTPAIVSIKYVSTDNADPTKGTPLFVIALQDFTMAGIFSGLHEDFAMAAMHRKQAMEVLAHARSRYDMQKPKRALWNSRIAAARRVRHPYPQVGINWWSGTGSSG